MVNNIKQNVGPIINIGKNIAKASIMQHKEFSNKLCILSTPYWCLISYFNNTRTTFKFFYFYLKIIKLHLII
ncbi:hypothetical protein GCM10008909_07710 [Hathewaya limosa]